MKTLWILSELVLLCFLFSFTCWSRFWFCKSRFSLWLVTSLTVSTEWILNSFLHWITQGSNYVQSHVFGFRSHDFLFWLVTSLTVSTEWILNSFPHWNTQGSDYVQSHVFGFRSHDFLFWLVTSRKVTPPQGSGYVQSQKSKVKRNGINR